MNATELVHRARTTVGLSWNLVATSSESGGPEPLPRHILAALHVPRSSMALRDRSGNFSEPWSWSQSSQVTPGP